MLLLPTLFLCASVAWAQSGRKAQKTTPPTAEATRQGESESGAAKQGATKTPDALVSFVVMQYDDVTYGLDPLALDGVADNFIRRLGASRVVSVTSAGKGRRPEARKRAKEETTSYVVLFQMEEEIASSGSMGRVDSRTLVLKTYVYTPKTGDLKYTDTIYQRPYRQTARIGGVPIPVPTHRIERYPSQLELEQAARDAADRLLSRFQITPPPDN
ncbi:MAG: hypothetical protein QOC61_2040 [Acidobacteriota bacterium]|jgi:hypothetical protein|nr:hypothetical protein [Acidobacteriota bacterium]